MTGVSSPERAAGGSRFWVTCYTDASFTRRAGGWGVWLRSARGRIVRQGACPPYVKSSDQAEMAAIFAGIYLAHRAWGAAVRGLVVYTDSQAAIGFLSKEAPRARVQRKAPGVMRLREKIQALAEEHGIELDLRWVKGHQRTNTVRAYLNQQCDRLAGAARVVAETRPRQRTSHGATRRREPPSAVEPAPPTPAVAPKRSREEKNRERRRRARERARARKAVAAGASATGTPAKPRP